MDKWSDVANNLVLLAEKKPRRALFLVVAILIGLYYVTHKPEKDVVSVHMNGTQGQTAGTNNGTMVQENK